MKKFRRLGGDYFEATGKTYEKAKLGPDVLLPRNLWIRDAPEKILECYDLKTLECTRKLLRNFLAINRTNKFGSNVLMSQGN
jgi:hypothetical protein